MEKIVGLGLAGSLAVAFMIYGSGPVEIGAVPPGIEGETALVYFGAHNCGACRRFEAKYKSGVEKSARTNGFTFVEKTIPSLRSLGREGVFGEYDAIHKAGIGKARNAVPMFVVVRDGMVIDAATGDWSGMVKLAMVEAE